MKYITLLVFMLIGFSCGKRDSNGQTKASITLGRAFLAGQTGGIIVYGHNKDNNDYFGIELGENSSTHTIELDNGLWEFLAVGWNGAGPLQGEPRCGEANDVQLTGEDKFININISKVNCNQSLYGGKLSRHNANRFNQLVPVSCLNYNRDKHEIRGDSNGGFNVEECIHGTMKSYKIVLPEILPGTNKLGIDKSKGLITCINMNLYQHPPTPYESSDHTPDKTIFIPSFNDSEKAGIPLIVTGYSESNCSGESQEFIFSKGLAAEIPNRARVSYESDKSFLFIQDNACSFSNISARTYGTTYNGPNEYNIICTPKQLQDIGANNNYNYANNFILMGNIDFGGINLGQNQFLGAGTNDYFGIFRGNGHTISNYNVSVSSSSIPFGFIAKLSGTFLDTYFDNINVTLNDRSQVGIAIGKGHNVTIENVHVKNSSLTVSATVNYVDVGMVAGRIEGSNSYIEKISSISNSITFDDNYWGIGGAIGTLSSFGTNAFSIYTSDVDINNTGSGTAQDVGGVIGLIEQGANANNTFANNININLDSEDNVGGAVGRITDSDFSFSKSSGAITMINGGDFIGGVIGKFESSIGQVYASSLKSTVNISATGIVSSIGGVIGDIQNTSSGSPLSAEGLYYPGGTITCKGSGNVHCGGVIGNILNSSASTINLSKLYSQGSINTDASSSKIGGLIGAVSGTPPDSILISEGESEMNLYTTGTTGSFGGLVGYANDSANFSNIYFTGTIDDNGAHSTIVGNCASCDALDIFSEFTSANAVDLSGTPGSWTNCQVAGATTGTCTTGTISYPNTLPWSSTTPGKLKYQEDLESFGYNIQGSEIEPYIITSIDQFLSIKDHSFLMYSSFKLANNLDFTGVTFVPIGSSANPFHGHFDGNNKILENINYSSINNVGVFSVLGEHAVIGGHNTDNTPTTLTISNSTFHSTGLNTGALAGMITDTASHEIRIANVIVDQATTVTGTGNTGGIIGNVNFLNSKSTLELLVNKANVYSSGCNDTGFGGVIGKLYSTASEFKSSYFVNKGNIDAGLCSNVGGIVGYISASSGGLEVASNTGNISGANEVGGIYGVGDASLEYAYSKNSNIQGASKVGGLIGEILTGTQTIKGVYTTSNVSASTSDAGQLIGRVTSSVIIDHAFATDQTVVGPGGGFIGMGSGTVTNSYSIDGSVGTIPISSASFKSYSNVSALDFVRFFTIDKDGVDIPRIKGESIIDNGLYHY